MELFDGRPLQLWKDRLTAGYAAASTQASDATVKQFHSPAMLPSGHIGAIKRKPALQAPGFCGKATNECVPVIPGRSLRRSILLPGGRSSLPQGRRQL